MCADCSMFATVSLKEVQTKQAIDYGPEDDAMDVDEPEAAPAEDAPAPVEGARPQPLVHPRAARSQPARTDAAPPAEEPAEPAAAAAEEPAAAEDDGAPSLALDPATITKKLKVVELRELLSERGLSTQGNKDVLIERLHDWATGGDAESASDEIAEVVAEAAAPAAAEEGYASASECLRNSSCKCTDCVPAVAELPVGGAAPLTTGSEMPTEQASGCAATHSQDTRPSPLHRCAVARQAGRGRDLRRLAGRAPGPQELESAAGRRDRAQGSLRQRRG